MTTQAGAAEKGGTDHRCDSPGFVLCAARSGSTLLRLILNAHPEIACPPETNLGDIFSAVSFSMAGLRERTHDERDPAHAKATGERVAEICRGIADDLIGEYSASRGKRVWVDKSLSSVFHAELLAEIFPGARFICLYRQCADTMASLREACGWGFDNYGVLPYVQGVGNGNLAQAFALYWAERTSLLQAFETNHPNRALRLRYEDLVTDPNGTVSQMLSFLDVRADSAAVETALAFQTDRPTVVPGDLKVRFSQSVDQQSVGRGWSVPSELLTTDLRERVNSLASELGYAPLHDLKEFTNGPATALIGRAAAGRHPSELTELLRRRAQTEAGLESEATGDVASVVKLVMTDLPEPWRIDLQRRQLEIGDGSADWLALTDSETLMGLISGRANPGTAMRNSTLKLTSSSDRTPDEYLDCVDALVTLLRD